MSVPVFPAAEESGAYRAPERVDPLRARAEGSGTTWFEVDLAAVRNKTRLLEAIARACGFPANFGGNWDALADALQDLWWRPARGYVLHLRNGGAASAALGAEWSVLVEVLRASATYWKARGKPFIALIDEAAGLEVWR